MGVHWKIWFLGWGGGAWMFLFREGGAWIFLGGWGDELPKKGGAWIVCRFNRGLGKRRGYEFEVRPQCTLWVGEAFLLTQISKANNIQYSIITNNINYNWHIVSQKTQ